MELNNNVENSAELLADAFSEELAKLEPSRQVASPAPAATPPEKPEPSRNAAPAKDAAPAGKALR